MNIDEKYELLKSKLRDMGKVVTSQVAISQLPA